MKNILMILVAGVLITGCNDETDLEAEPTREGDGRVICYADDGTEFFNHVGSYVDLLSNGGVTFMHLSNHPDIKKGRIKFTPAWKCIVEDW